MRRSCGWRAGLWGVLAAMVVLVAMAPVASADAGRAYEQVSPVDKHGGDVMPFVPRTRVSADGDAVGYASLVGFGDVHGTGAAVEYLAQRTPTGWVTHAISATQTGGSLNALITSADSFYDGSFSSDFQRGIFFSARALTGDDSVQDVPNLYRRDDLRTSGRGTYELLSACPACSTPLPPLSSDQTTASQLLQTLAGASPDLAHIAFESLYDLTSDAPAQTAFCGYETLFFPPPAVLFCWSRLYEWDNGTLRYAAFIPPTGDTACGGSGSACVPADVSFAGSKARNPSLTPHVVSDGSDGRSRIFFTQPTDDTGVTVSDFDPTDLFAQFGAIGVATMRTGKLFMRLDHTETVQLNVSERTVPDAYAPARYLDATPDGQRVFFITNQALTDDAPAGGVPKIYMYDASKPESAPDNLTFLNVDNEPADGGGGVGLIGTSRDGHYVYMIVQGQLLAGGPLEQPRLYLWHDGVIRDIGRVPDFETNELVSSGPNYQVGSTIGAAEQQAAVTPDGRHLVFTSYDGSSLGGYDHGACRNIGGCREVYVYSADTDTLACASCNPTGATATADATLFAEENNGGARGTEHILDHVISDDGTRVFFTSGEALVLEDTNGRNDAYEYDIPTRTLRLISTGKDPSDSWFIDASASGRDVFFVTRQQLVGWDRDNNYDLYDARVGGGFPEPPPTPPACSDDSCQGAAAFAPAAGATTSTGFRGHGNLSDRLKRRARRARACRRGRVRRHHRCVRRHRAHRSRAAGRPSG